MSVTERDPQLIEGDATPTAPAELLLPREVPLGGPRAMLVRRTLPQRSRSLIGAWCFVDHWGPSPVAERGTGIPGHPHTGLATVTWLFAGEMEHRDTAGTVAVIRPGQVNLMTAGRGVAHSEASLPDTTVVQGAQLWFALPDGVADGPRRFEHAEPVPTSVGGAEVRVFVGEWLGITGAPLAPTPQLGAEVRLPPGLAWRAGVDPTFEVGVLVDTGSVTVEGIAADATELVALPPGRAELAIAAGPEGARVLVLAGEPFPSPIVMWWNFVGRTHDDIVEARADWQRQVDQQRSTGTADGRFGPHPAAWQDVLAAPELPTVRLRPRTRG